MSKLANVTSNWHFRLILLVIGLIAMSLVTAPQARLFVGYPDSGFMKSHVQGASKMDISNAYGYMINDNGILTPERLQLIDNICTNDPNKQIFDGDGIVRNAILYYYGVDLGRNPLLDCGEVSSVIV